MKVVGRVGGKRWMGRCEGMSEEVGRLCNVIMQGRSRSSTASDSAYANNAVLGFVPKIAIELTESASTN